MPLFRSSGPSFRCRAPASKPHRPDAMHFPRGKYGPDPESCLSHFPQTESLLSLSFPLRSGKEELQEQCLILRHLFALYRRNCFSRFPVLSGTYRESGP